MVQDQSLPHLQAQLWVLPQLPGLWEQFWLLPQLVSALGQGAGRRDRVTALGDEGCLRRDRLI